MSSLNFVKRPPRIIHITKTYLLCTKLASYTQLFLGEVAINAKKRAVKKVNLTSAQIVHRRPLAIIPRRENVFHLGSGEVCVHLAKFH